MTPTNDKFEFVCHINFRSQFEKFIMRIFKIDKHITQRCQCETEL